jgi:hypothetical protein
VSSDSLLPEFKVPLAVDIALAALLGEGVYGFAQLLMHPIVTVLQEGSYAWLGEMLEVFNRCRSRRGHRTRGIGGNWQGCGIVNGVLRELGRGARMLEGAVGKDETQGSTCQPARSWAARIYQQTVQQPAKSALSCTARRCIQSFALPPLLFVTSRPVYAPPPPPPSPHPMASPSQR